MPFYLLQLMSQTTCLWERRLKMSVSSSCNNIDLFKFLRYAKFLSVAVLKRLPVHRYSVIFYIFWSFGTVWSNSFILGQSCAQPNARRFEGCRICRYLSGIESAVFKRWVLHFQSISFQIIYSFHSKPFLHCQ